MVEGNPKYGFSLKVTANRVHLDRYTTSEADVSLGEKTMMEETQEMHAWLIWLLLCFTSTWSPGPSEAPTAWISGDERRKYLPVGIYHPWIKDGPMRINTPTLPGCVSMSGQQFCQVFWCTKQAVTVQGWLKPPEPDCFSSMAGVRSGTKSNWITIWRCPHDMESLW